MTSQATAPAPAPGTAGARARTRDALWFGLAVLVLVAIFWAIGSTILYVGKPFPGFRFGPTLTLTAGGLPTWQGYRAGLAEEDIIVSIDGKPAQGPEQLWALARSVPVGTTLTYGVEGPSGKRQIAVPTAVFTLADWALAVLPFGLVALVFWFIGVSGFALRRDNAAARVHLAFTLAMAGFLGLGMDYDFGAHLGRLYSLTPYLLGSAAVHLALGFPVRSAVSERFPWLLRAVYGSGLLLGAAAGAVYRPVAAGTFAQYGLYQALWWLGGMSWLLAGVAILLVSLLSRALRPPTFIAGQQARIAVFGAILAAAPLALIWAIPTLFRLDLATSALVAPASIFTFLAFPAAVSYAIVRTRLFDIDLVIRRTLQYALVVGILGTLYFAVLVLANFGMQRLLPGGATEVTHALAAGFLALAFAPVSQRVRGLLDRAFSRGSYDSARVLIDFGQAARRATEPAQLLAAFQAALDGSFKPSWVSVELPGLAEHKAGTRSLVPDGRALEVVLQSGDDTVGRASVGPRLSDLPYADRDCDLLEGLCRQLASAVDFLRLIKRVRDQDRIAKEVEIAQDVQAGLLPAKLPAIPDARIAAHYEVALEMGGDFYDVIPLPDGAFGIVVGDISGKGVASSLLAAVCLSFFRAIAPLHRSPIEAVQAVNQVFYEHRGSKKMFAAISYVVFHPGLGWVSGVNAGNPAPLVDGRPIAAKGMPLGAARSLKYIDFELILEPGETLALFSDGLTDARDTRGERFGEERLAALVASHTAQDPVALVATVRESLAAFQADKALYDDLTIVALQRVSAIATV